MTPLTVERGSDVHAGEPSSPLPRPTGGEDRIGSLTGSCAHATQEAVREELWVPQQSGWELRALRSPAPPSRGEPQMRVYS